MSRPITKLEEFQTAEWDHKIELLNNVETTAAVEAWLGSKAFAELKDFRAVGHLSAGAKNLIVVPGVMGTSLNSSGVGGIWWLDLISARDKLNKLALSAGGNEDMDPGYEIMPAAIDVCYGPMREAFRHSGLFGGSKEFPYDWRKPLAASAGRLRDFIHAVQRDCNEPVHLVGHSMGGLMIRITLMLYGEELWPELGKIVFIATPHYGSPSIAGYLKNHLWGWEQVAILGAFLSRETFRSLWGVLSLLPAPAGIYPGTRDGEPHPCANFDMYRAEAWKLDLDARATIELQRALNAGAQFHRDLYDWHTNVLSSSNRQRMLQISGVGYKTLFRLEAQSGWHVGRWGEVGKITQRAFNDPHREGDGRVPLASAELENVEHRYAKGSHGSIQNVPSVAQEILAWIADQPLSLPDTAQGALSGHLAATEASPTPHLDGSADISIKDDEYDRYREIPPDRIKELLANFVAGRMPDINQVKIL